LKRLALPWIFCVLAIQPAQAAIGWLKVAPVQTRIDHRSLITVKISGKPIGQFSHASPEKIEFISAWEIKAEHLANGKKALYLLSN
jgi:hypothetical protein